ncbi:ABC transporter substrate-binding protein, partial [Streptomyces roseolus]
DSSEVAGTVRKTISSSKQNVLWFEALFSTKATTLSNTSAPGLVNGSVSPKQFMETVQAALDSQ